MTAALHGRPCSVEEAIGAAAALLSRARMPLVFGLVDSTFEAQREAMALAAERHSVAREYATNYDRTFGTVVPALWRARRAGHDWPAAAVEAHLATLALVPDTLIARKEGMETARQVSGKAEEVVALAAGLFVALAEQAKGEGA